MSSAHSVGTAPPVPCNAHLPAWPSTPSKLGKKEDTGSHPLGRKECAIPTAYNRDTVLPSRTGHTATLWKDPEENGWETSTYESVYTYNCYLRDPSAVDARTPP